MVEYDVYGNENKYVRFKAKLNSIFVATESEHWDGLVPTTSADLRGMFDVPGARFGPVEAITSYSSDGSVESLLAIRGLTCRRSSLLSRNT